MDERHRMWLLGCGILSMLPLVLLPFCQMRSAHREIEQMAAGEGEVIPAPPPPAVRPVSVADRIERLLAGKADRSSKDGSLALALCQERLASSGLEATERGALRRLLPRTYLAAHEEALGAGQRALAIRLVREVLERRGPAPRDEAAAWRSTAGDLLRTHEEWSRRELDAGLAGDPARADAALAAAWEDPYAVLPHQPATVIEHLLARRRAALAREGDEAQILLARAAEVAIACTHLGYDDVRDTPLERALAAEHGFEELLAMGSRYEKAGEPALATAYLMALKRHPDWEARAKTYRERWELELPIRRSMLALARSIEAGRHRWLPPDLHTNHAIILAQMAVALAHEVAGRAKLVGDAVPYLALATEANDTVLDLHLGRLRRLDQAGEATEHTAEEFLIGSLLDHVHFLAAHAGRDPLEGVPEPLHAELAARSTTPLERWAALSEAVRRGRHRLAGPGAPEAERILWGVRAREAIGKKDLALARRVLREAPADLAKTMALHLEERIREARARSDWGELYTVGGFYVAELGQDVPASVRDELASALAAAADAFAQSHKRIARVFLLSLMADVRCDSPEGPRLREEALRLGFEATADIPESAEPRHAEHELPSGIEGVSIAAVVNACEIPLLVFYDGPERFFVRIDAMRRGSIVLRDGAYRVAVIGAQEDLRPYRGRETCASRYGCVRYYVQRADRPPPDPSTLTGFFGPWRVLRTPDDTGRYRVIDPERGLVTRED